MGNNIDKLTEYFARFPGIGPRQAKRFVYFLLSQPQGFNNELARHIGDIKTGASLCASCMRFFASSRVAATECSICINKNRNAETLLIVEKDSDLENVERSNSYDGFYFVLGGSVPILEKEPGKRVRLAELKRAVEARAAKGLKEIVLAFSVNPDGEHTADVVSAELSPARERYGLKVTKLGRGLSTGSELEYADPDTLKSALKNRA